MHVSGVASGDMGVMGHLLLLELATLSACLVAQDQATLGVTTLESAASVQYRKAELVNRTGDLTGAIGEKVTIMFVMRSASSVRYKLMQDRDNLTTIVKLAISAKQTADKDSDDPDSKLWTYEGKMKLQSRAKFGRYLMTARNEAGLQTFDFTICPTGSLLPPTSSPFPGCTLPCPALNQNVTIAELLKTIIELRLTNAGLNATNAKLNTTNYVLGIFIALLVALIIIGLPISRAKCVTKRC